MSQVSRCVIYGLDKLKRANFKPFDPLFMMAKQTWNLKRGNSELTLSTIAPLYEYHCLAAVKFRCPA